MPLTSILYLSITFFNVGIGSFLYKKAQTLGIRSGSFMVVQAFSFLFVVTIALLIRGEPFAYTPGYRFGVLTGLFGIIGAVAVLMSLKKGELGINTALVRLSFIPTVLGAFIFLNEEFTSRKLAILILGLLSIFLFADHYRRHNPIALSSLIPAGIACISFGIFDLIYKAAVLEKVDPLYFVFIQSFTANIIIHAYVLFYEKYKINRHILIIGPVCGVLFATACLSFLKALEYVDISLVSPILQMNFIVSYLLGIIFLGESVTRRKLIGIGCVVVAVLLLSLT